MRAGRMGTMPQRPGLLRLENFTLFSHPGQRLDIFFKRKLLKYLSHDAVFNFTFSEKVIQFTSLWTTFPREPGKKNMNKITKFLVGTLPKTLTKLRSGHGTPTAHLQYNLNKIKEEIHYCPTTTLPKLRIGYPTGFCPPKTYLLPVPMW
jgi:hypothetical protein